MMDESREGAKSWFALRLTREARRLAAAVMPRDAGRARLFSGINDMRTNDAHAAIAPDAEDDIAPEDRERVRAIRAAARQEGAALRKRHPWLARHQDAIGLGLLLGSAAVMASVAALYAGGFVPAIAAVIAIALACSIAHEIEHDLIHRMYFPRSRGMRNAMLALGWLMRPSTVNPWVRVRLHLDHHRLSGTEHDLEERGITNGEPWGPKRLVMTADSLLSVWLRLPVLSRPKRAAIVVIRATLGFFPMGWVYHGLWAAYLAGHVMPLVGAAPPAWVVSALPTVDFLAVVWLWPNLLRTFCLHFVSSNIHYYGDVRVGDVFRQTQVIDRWFFLPFQLFCFNFGATHAIHHFWVPETFYIRQVTAKRVHEAMRRAGVRFNDLGTFARANRYAERVEATSGEIAGSPTVVAAR